jgi:broad specificity phosphatase PhoE
MAQSYQVVRIDYRCSSPRQRQYLTARPVSYVTGGEQDEQFPDLGLRYPVGCR